MASSSGIADGGTDAAGSYGPLHHLERLRQEALQGKPEVLPDRLPLDKICVLEGLFQPRATDERHIQELVRVIKNRKVLDPVDVIQVGPNAYLCEGHHRVNAYRFAKVTYSVPVRYFQGTLEEAVLHSRGANAKAKLPMTTRERTEAAWELTLMGIYEKKAIMRAASVSDSLVAIMRRVIRQIGDDAYSAKGWWDAQRIAKDRGEYELSDEERQALLDRQVQQYADRLSKEFGNKLSTNPQLAARAFEIYFGRKIVNLACELKEHLDHLDDDELSDY